MSKMSERRFCPSDGGHWHEGGFCPEHDSRAGYHLGTLLLWISFIFIVMLLVSGFWAYCTVTDPEYWEEFYFR
ncbi:hypothetical protein LCGC14_0859420 [marine sediment metagenome]|uniref:Uncharacterized protein n=1 Tax=marine sediment metagenome TaxID=412755 RepID=A0A0F9PT78_9ZZZZ